MHLPTETIYSTSQASFCITQRKAMKAFIMMTCCLSALSLPVLVAAAPLDADYVRILPLDCQEIYRSGVNHSGVHIIYPSNTMPVEVYCEMGCSEDPTQAWTVIQRRMNGSVNFYRNWEHYRNGFGNKNGEYWLGLENIYQLTHNRKLELRVDLQDFEGGSVYARYTTFFIESEAEGYRLHVSGFLNGGAGDSMTPHNGQKFSTFDKDQDTYSGNCAKSFLGAFWYSDCHNTNPNGIYLQGRDGTHYAIGNVWAQWKGYDYGLKYIAMKIRPVCDG